MFCQTPLKSFIAVIVLILCLSAVTSSRSCAASSALEPVLGLWVTQGYGSRVEIAPCAERPAELCGRIVWLWEANDENGAPLKDRKNPRREARNAPLLGAKILRGFHVNENGSYEGGTIYNPEDGGTYRATLRPIHDNRLEVRGCLIFFCQRQIWLRPEVFE